MTSASEKLRMLDPRVSPHDLKTYHNVRFLIANVVEAAEKSHLCNAPNTHIGVALAALNEHLNKDD